MMMMMVEVGVDDCADACLESRCGDVMMMMMMMMIMVLLLMKLRGHLQYYHCAVAVDVGVGSVVAAAVVESELLPTAVAAPV
jgi:hypothetical protein